MSGKLIVWTMVLLMVVQMGWAAPTIDHAIVYTLVEDSAIVEHTFLFSELQREWQMKLPRDAEAIEMQDHTFEIVESEDSLLITATDVTSITLKYISDSFVEKTKDRYFTVNLAPFAGSKDIKVILPESATLKYSMDSSASAVVPSPSNLTTDGKRIQVHWDAYTLTHANSILIIYEMPGLNPWNWLLILSLCILAVAAGIGVYVLKKKRTVSPAPGKKVRHASAEDPALLTRNLFGEEKAIIELLLKAKDNELWQKTLQFETGLAKVKLSRKLRALESKGLIEKIPFGNTNKIRMKRK